MNYYRVMQNRSDAHKAVTVAGFAKQFAISRTVARECLEAAAWNRMKAFESLKSRLFATHDCSTTQQLAERMRG